MSKLYSCDVHLGAVFIQKGIFYGICSHLSFLLVLIPITKVLQKVRGEYDLEKNNREHSRNHLLFMDDIKLFAKSEEQIDSLL